MDKVTLVDMQIEIKNLRESIDDLSDLIKHYHNVAVELERRARDLEETIETAVYYQNITPDKISRS